MVNFYDVIVKEKSTIQKYVSELQLFEIYQIWANIREDYTKVNVMGVNAFSLHLILFKIIK